MIISSAKFVISNTKVNKCPEATIPEYAFIGRSNVGKSSLINMLVNNNKLAKTSSTPGKTQTINHFIINDDWYLVDLPGYGYAKSSKKDRETWEKFIMKYLFKRENLMCTYVLVDSRHKPQKIDLEFIAKLGENQIPFVIVFTKTDKLKKAELSKNISNYKKELLKEWEELPELFFTSSEKKIGKNEILNHIEMINPLFQKP